MIKSIRTQGSIAVFVGRFVAASFAACSGLAAANAAQAQAGDVFTSTNTAAGNSVLRVHRLANGRLIGVASYPTGGNGAGASLGSQGALTLAWGNHFLYVVDAGSNDIAGFKVQPLNLTHISNTSSAGTTPVSLTTWGNLLYVLNSGGAGSISGYQIQSNGTLSPIPGSVQALSSTSAGAAEISFSPDGQELVVTEKATNKIDVFPVGQGGAAGEVIVTSSFGLTPYGFAFDAAGHLIVSEAAGGAKAGGSVSSYFVSGYGSLPVTGSALNDQTAPCWIAVSGRYAWTTNAGSGTISGYYINGNGTLQLIGNGGVAANIGATSKPLDMGLDAAGQYLYVLEGGYGAIGAYRVQADGSLVSIGSAGSLGTGLSGLVSY